MTGEIVPAPPTVFVLVNRVLAALPAIGKDSWNEQQRFHFRGIDAVLNNLNPLLAEHGVTVVPHMVLERIAGQRATKSGGVMYEVNLHVRFRLYGPLGDFIEGEAWGEGTDSGDKATSKAHTAAQKAFLVQAFNVSTKEQTEDEPDRNTPEETTGRAPRENAGAPAALSPSGKPICALCGKTIDKGPKRDAEGRWTHKVCGGGESLPPAGEAAAAPCRFCDGPATAHADKDGSCNHCAECPGYEASA